MQNVSNIIKWYKKNLRNLPWRETQDPYRIWISEVILQQTQVVTGLSYYERFLENFPDLHALATADSDHVLKIWQGLGYYSRARNLHKAARIIDTLYSGRFPDTYEEISSIPGIGDYTASAILSFAFGKAYPALDGNVFRVISRLFDIDLPIDVQGNRKVFKEILNQMISNQDPALFNNAMMELGAVICKPDKPLCHTCPAADWCLSYSKGNWSSRPVKSKKVKRRSRYFNYFFLRFDNQFYFVKRGDKDIWKNLYELPLVETSGEVKEPIEAISLLESNICAVESVVFVKQNSFKHVLTHQDINAKFWVFQLNKKPDFLIEGCVTVDLKSYTEFAVSALTQKFFLSL